MDYFEIPEEQIKRQITLKREKDQIKSHGAAVGISYIAVTIVGLFWATAVVFLLSKLGISENWFYKAISNLGVLQFIQTALSLLMFTIPFYVLFKWSGDSSNEVFALGKSEKGTFLPLALIGIGFCAFANIANSISGQIFLNLGFPDPFSEIEYPTGFFGFILTFISTAIMPPLVEEFAMRGAVLGVLRKFGDAFAIITSSVLFGLIHANLQQIVFATFVGLVLGFVRVKSGSLWTAVFVHFFNNLLSVFIYYFSKGVGVDASNIAYLLILIVSLFVGIIGICLYAKTGEGAFKLEKAKGLATEKEKYRWFFTSPFIIIAVVLTAFETVYRMIQ